MMLDKVRAGDEIISEYRGWGKTITKIVVVSRITKTQIVVQGIKFRRETGCRVGATKNPWMSKQCIRPLKEGDRETFLRVKALEKVDGIEWESLSTQDINKILRLINDLEGANQPAST